MKRAGEKKWLNPRRIIAVVLCVAMVLGVIYLDGSKKETSAAELQGAKDFTAFTDANFLSGSGVDFTDGQSYFVVSPSEKVNFGLPAIPDDAEGFSYAWYLPGEEPSVDTGDNTILVDTYTPVTEISSTVTLAKLYKKKPGASAVLDDPGTPEDETRPAVLAEVAALSSIEYKLQELTEIEVTADTTAMTLAITDTDPFYDQTAANTLYYADVKLAAVLNAESVETADPSKVSDWTDKASVTTSLNQDGDSYDGTWTVYKKVALPNDTDNPTLIYFYSTQVDRDFFINITDAEIVAGSQTGTLAEKVFTISGVKPTEDVTITFTSGDTTDLEAKAVLGSDVYTATNGVITIPGKAGNESAKNVNYDITVSKTGKHDIKYQTDITYLTATPKDPEITIYGKNKSGAEEAKTAISGKYYVGNADVPARIHVKAESEMDGVNVNAVVLNNETTSSEVATNTIDPAAKQAETDFSLTPDAGEAEYSVTVKTDADGQKKAPAFTVFYDPNYPSVTGISANQSGKPVVIGDDGRLQGKLNPGASVVFTFTASDAETTDSGFGTNPVTATLSQEGVTATMIQTGDVWTITVPSNDGFKGNDVVLTIDVTDQAGNTTTKTYTLSYSDQKTTVTHVIEPALSSEADTNAAHLDVNYTITSDTAVKSLEIRFRKEGSTEVTQTVDVADMVQTGTPETVGQYVYTYTFPLDVTASTIYHEIGAYGINAYNIAGDEDVINIVKIDLTSPEWQDEDPVDTKWYRDALLTVKYGDKVDGDYVAGVDKSAIKNLKGATIKGVTDNGDGTFTASLGVTPSKTEAGTEVSFTVEDKVGNPSAEFKQTYYIDDKMATVTGLLVNNKAPQDKLIFNGDPKITYKTEDNIAVDHVAIEISREGKVLKTLDPLEANGTNKTLSSMLGITGKELQDGRYTIKVSVWDKAVIRSTGLPEKNVQNKSITFKLDNTAPVVGISLDNSCRKVKKNPETYNNEKISFNYNYDKFIGASELSSVNGKKVVKLRLYVEEEGKDKAVVSGVDEKKITWIKGGMPGYYYADVTVSKEGETTVILEARDEAGNYSGKDSIKFTIDSVPPVITLKVNGTEQTEASADAGYFARPVTVDYAATDVKKDSSECKLTAVWVKNGTDDKETQTTQPLADGAKTFSTNAKYTLTYSAADYAGNVTTKKVTFIVDTVKPVVDLLIRDPENAAKFGTFQSSYSNPETGAAYKYAQYYNHDVVIGLRVSEFFPHTISVTDNGTVVRTQDNFTKPETKGGYYTAQYTASSEGEHTVVISSVDMSGNVASQQTVKFVIDKTAPVVSTTLNGTTFSEGNDLRYLTSGGNVGVTVTDAYKDANDLTRTLTVTPPGRGASTTVSKVSEGVDNFSEEADYSVTYKAIDCAGNESQARTVTFRVDKNAPVLTITSDAIEGISTKKVTVTYTIQEAFYQDLESATVKVYKKIDGSAETLLRTVALKPTGQTSHFSETFEEDGEYRFDFEAKDKTQNAAHASYTFSLDQTAPSLVLDGVKNYDKTTSDVDMQVKVTEAFYKSNKLTMDGSVVDIDQKKTAIETESFDVTTGREVNLNRVFKDDGIYDIQVKSSDRAGNSSEQGVHFTIDKTAPVIGDLSKYDGVRLNKFVWDIDEKELVRDLTVCDVTVYLDGTVYDGMSELADGSHVLKVTAVDELGNESSKEVSFLLDQIAPTIIVSGIEQGQRIEEATTINVSLQIDQDTLDSVELNGINQTISGNAASFKVEKSGDYNLVVKAHDDAGNESKLDWNFSFGKDFNWWWIVLIGGGALLLFLIIFLIVKKKRW